MSNLLFFLSNSQDATCDYLCKIADEERVNYVRFDTDFCGGDVKIEFDLNKNIVLNVENRIIKLDDIKCIWNRRPEKIHAGNYGYSPFDRHYKDEWRHSLDGFFKQIPVNKWINHPYNNVMALSKIEQLVRASKYQLSIPKTIVTQSKNSFLSFLHECKNGIITKPLSHGYIDGEDTVYNIYTSQVDLEKNDFSCLSKCPTMFQERIEKDCDIRINYIDGLYEAFALKYFENGFQRLDIRINNMEGVEYTRIELPKSILFALTNMIDSYNLRFAAIDMAITTKGEWVFFEINPNGQWAWMDILGVSSFHKKLINCMLMSKNND